MPDPGKDDEPGTTDRGGGAPRGGGTQQRILRTVQDQGWHTELGQPAAVPVAPGLTASRRGVADAANLVPFGHPAHFLFVDGIGRRRDGASGGDGQRDVTVMALGEPHPGQPGHGAHAHVPGRPQAAGVAGQ